MSVEVGSEIPPWTMSSVDPARMKTMAAILRDPYPIHWDHQTVEALGFGERVINQGPLSLAYVVNMLLAWQGPGCVRHLNARFRRPVHEDDSVTAVGTVVELAEVDGELLATCDVRLVNDGEDAVVGSAVVIIGG